MSDFDTTEIQNQTALSEQDKSQTTPEPNEENKEIKDPDSETIILDGPLSLVYTKALNLLYSNKKEDNEVSTESQQMDTFIEAKAVLDLNDITSDSKKYKDNTYVYVTDTDNVKDNNSFNIAFERLTKLGNNKHIFKNILVCIEGRDFNTKTGILESYLNDVGIKVYHSREAMINSLTNKFSTEDYKKDHVCKTPGTIYKISFHKDSIEIKLNLPNGKLILASEQDAKNTEAELHYALEKVLSKFFK